MLEVAPACVAAHMHTFVCGGADCVTGAPINSSACAFEMNSHGSVLDVDVESVGFTVVFVDAASPVCTAVAGLGPALFLSLLPHAPSTSAAPHKSTPTRATPRRFA